MLDYDMEAGWVMQPWQRLHTFVRAPWKQGVLRAMTLYGYQTGPFVERCSHVLGLPIAVLPEVQVIIEELCSE